MKKQMPIDEYCQWIEALTASGDTVSAKGLQNWIETYAKNYHEEQARIAVAKYEERKEALNLQRVSLVE